VGQERERQGGEGRGVGWWVGTNVSQGVGKAEGTSSGGGAWRTGWLYGLAQHKNGPVGILLEWVGEEDERSGGGNQRGGWGGAEERGKQKGGSRGNVKSACHSQGLWRGRSVGKRNNQR